MLEWYQNGEKCLEGDMAGVGQLFSRSLAHERTHGFTLDKPRGLAIENF